ncbi:TraB/GumN family protein [Caenimonas soli]|uniref:TraB/GumN family protein n=1 Tax=Caenimonas soli TaxID=2735555 RepID=UPI001557622D|nr:TraB/GumN family protein [Caenimonas soli]NPC58771.1 TraB/GumN family protein [Caenimonas soli]
MPRLLPHLRAGLVLLACLIAPSVLRAQADCPKAPAPDAPALAAMQAAARDRGMLWRVEKGGRSSWLYGTIHAARMEWLMPGPAVAGAIQASDVVAVEIDISDPDLPAVFAKSGGAAISERLLDAPRRERIERLGRKACVPAGALQPLRPLMQVITLAMFDARWSGIHPEFAIDAVLVGLARAAGKRVVALETAEQQLAALMPASDAEELELVDGALADMEQGTGRTMMRQLTDVWANGDEPTLLRFPEWCECMRTPLERTFYRRLNDDRNAALADKLAALHDGGARVFAGVGLLHMTGAQALPALMRARGFNVQRIPFRATP